MTIDELKKMLEDGKITPETFETMAKAIDPNYQDNGGNEPPANDDKPATGFTQEEVEKMIQKAVDRKAQQMGTDNKKLREQLEALKNEKLTAEERAELERKAEREAFERERAEFQAEKNKLYAIKAIKAAGLDDGSDQSLALVDFVTGPDEATIDANVKAFGALVRKFVAAEVDKTFKSAGRTPGKGGGGDSEVNPYAAETFNLTRQMELETNDPEKAKRLQAAALAAK